MGRDASGRMEPGRAVTGDEDWFDAVPKVELHLHLEGAIPLPALTELARKYGVAQELAHLQVRFADHDPDFREMSVWRFGYLRELDDFTFMAEAVARELAAQQIRYVEAFCSPPEFQRYGLTTGAIIGAVRKGLDRVPTVDVRLVPDLVRDLGPARAARTLEEVAEQRSLGVIGVGLGGLEHAFPPEPFASVFERARLLGLRTTAHAGETAGAGSVWAAIRVLRVDRVGHGTRAEEDGALVAHLAEARIPLEMCPVSDVRSGMLPDLAAHPIRMFFDRKLRVTVNSNEPVLRKTSLACAYRELCRVHGFGLLEVRSLIENAVLACWLDPDAKAHLLASIWKDPGWALDPGWSPR